MFATSWDSNVSDRTLATVCSTGKSLADCRNPLSSPFCKNISLHPDGQIKGITPRVSPKRGADHDRHERCGEMRWTRELRRRTWRMRTAQACGPGAPMLASSCAGSFRRGDGWQESPFTGEITK